MVIIQTMSEIGEANKKGSVENDGEIGNKNTVNKGKNDGLDKLEHYDDYYDDLEACDDGNRRAHRNAEFRQQLYENMLVEDFIFLTVTMHMLQRGRRLKRRENGIEIRR
jgi:hypothetical protein